jgi:hypothetical protein
MASKTSENVHLTTSFTCTFSHVEYDGTNRLMPIRDYRCAMRHGTSLQKISGSLTRIVGKVENYGCDMVKPYLFRNGAMSEWPLAKDYYDKKE